MKNKQTPEINKRQKTLASPSASSASEQKKVPTQSSEMDAAICLAFMSSNTRPPGSTELQVEPKNSQTTLSLYEEKERKSSGIGLAQFKNLLCCLIEKEFVDAPVLKEFKKAETVDALRSVMESSREAIEYLSNSETFISAFGELFQGLSLIKDDHHESSSSKSSSVSGDLNLDSVISSVPHLREKPESHSQFDLSKEEVMNIMNQYFPRSPLINQLKEAKNLHQLSVKAKEASSIFSMIDPEATGVKALEDFVKKLAALMPKPSMESYGWSASLLNSIPSAPKAASPERETDSYTPTPV